MSHSQIDFDRCERYELSNGPNGLRVLMWEVLPRVGGGVIGLVILAACFATDPYEGHGRIWAGLGVMTLAVVALFGVRIESWLISDEVVSYKASLWNKELSFSRSNDQPLQLRIEHLPGDSDGTRPPFPHVVRVIGPGGVELGDGFHFNERGILDRFLEAVQTVSLIEVDHSLIQ